MTISRLLLASSLVALVGLVGCSSKSSSDPSASASNAETTPEASDNAESDSTAASPDAASDTAASDTAASDTAAPSSTDASADTAVSGAADDPASVKLGDGELTTGIPGDGPLTVAEIEKWLEDPQNHVTLQVSLPMGLAAGAGQIHIPEDNPITRAKVELGRQLYFDRRLSADSTVSCADCHHPEEGFARSTQFGVGIDGQTGDRNSPVSFNRIVSRAQFWDGRAASLEEQAVGPIANPIEMGNTHEAAVKTVAGIEGYQKQFDKIFDDGVTIDNIGKAIATFERAIVTGPSPYDYYEPLRVMETALKDDLEDLDALKEEEPELYEKYMATAELSNANPVSESAKRGRDVFFGQRGGCTACHVGANFTDEKYHNIGVGMGVENPNPGRAAVTKEDKDTGAYKTPTIRNVALTAPYMHDGSVKTLEEVVDLYDKGGEPNDHLSKDVRKLNLTDQEKKDLVAFMIACTGEYPKIATGRLPE